MIRIIIVLASVSCGLSNANLFCSSILIGKYRDGVIFESSVPTNIALKDVPLEGYKRDRSNENWTGNVALSNKYVAATTSTGFVVWDIQTGKKVSEHKGSYDLRGVVNRALARFSPDGALLAITEMGDGVLIWDIKRGVALRRIPVDTRNLGFSSDGKNVISANIDNPHDIKTQGFVRSWRIGDGEEMPCFNPPLAIDCACGGQEAIARRLGVPDSTLSPLLGEMIQQVQSQGLGALAPYLNAVSATEGETFEYGVETLSANGEMVALQFHASNDVSSNNVAIWNVRKRELLAIHRDQDKEDILGFTPEGSHVVKAHGKDQIRLLPSKPDEAIVEFEADFPLPYYASDRGVAFTQSRSPLMFVGTSQGLSIWDVNSRARLSNMVMGGGWVRSISISPDSNYLAFIVQEPPDARGEKSPNLGQTRMFVLDVRKNFPHPLK